MNVYFNVIIWWYLQNVLNEIIGLEAFKCYSEEQFLPLGIKLMRFNRVKSTNRFLIEFESIICESNFHFDSSGPIYSSRQSDLKSRSKFEVRFEFESEFVDLYRKSDEFDRKWRFRFKKMTFLVQIWPIVDINWPFSIK